jgi:anaerobic magnesium-protoporphyrin IX monomethyl ester cyclase
MDIVLFNPAPRAGKQVQRRVELPLSLLCTATPLDRLGYRIQIIDEFANPGWKQELLDALEERPICFGVTCMTGPQIWHALEGCRLVRERHADVPIVWGGVHASLMPQQTLSHPLVDIVVVGEGEETFLELVKALESGTPLHQIAGIWYKDDKSFAVDPDSEGAPSVSRLPVLPTGSDCSTAGGKVETNGYRWTGERPFVSMDEQPPLSYHLVEMDSYRRRLFGIDHVSFNSSRGCTFRCNFCWDPVMHKRRWRAMQPETVLEQLRRIITDYRIRGFLFTDDHFFIDMKRARGILEAIVRADLDISISKLQIRADTICKMDKEFLELLVRAKVKRLTVGVESGSPRLLDLIKKDVTVEEVIQANRKLKPYPIVPIYLFMMGLPSETPEEFKESVRLAIQLTDENPRAVKTFNIYTPYPGTQLYDVCVEQGLREPDSLEGWGHFNFRNVAAESPWLPDETRKMVTALDFPLMFLGKGHFVNPYKKTNPLVVGLAKLYYPVARHRVAHFETRWPIESKVVKSMGLFGRQE